jgi:hypothetical protein
MGSGFSILEAKCPTSRMKFLFYEKEPKKFLKKHKD